MNLTAAQIAEAASLLSHAGHALRCGHLKVAEQFALGTECYEVAAQLRALLKSVEVEVEA